MAGHYDIAFSVITQANKLCEYKLFENTINKLDLRGMYGSLNPVTGEDILFYT